LGPPTEIIGVIAAGAPALAGLAKARDLTASKRCRVVLCGGDIDAPVMAGILAGRTPRPILTGARPAAVALRPDPPAPRWSRAT
jgi:threonine dehydratase